MANGQMLATIDSLLSSESIDPQAALRVMLASQRDILDWQAKHKHAEYACAEHSHPKTDEAIEGLKRRDVGGWVALGASAIVALVASFTKP